MIKRLRIFFLNRTSVTMRVKYVRSARVTAKRIIPFWIVSIVTIKEFLWFGDCIHQDEVRKFYALERLWGDAPEADVSALITE